MAWFCKSLSYAFIRYFHGWILNYFRDKILLFVSFDQPNGTNLRWFYNPFDWNFAKKKYFKHQQKKFFSFLRKFFSSAILWNSFYIEFEIGNVNWVNKWKSFTNKMILWILQRKIFFCFWINASAAMIQSYDFYLLHFYDFFLMNFKTLSAWKSHIFFVAKCMSSQWYEL